MLYYIKKIQYNINNLRAYLPIWRNYWVVCYKDDYGRIRAYITKDYTLAKRELNRARRDQPEYPGLDSDKFRWGWQ